MLSSITSFCDLSFNLDYWSRAARKTVFGGPRPGPTQTRLHIHRRSLDTYNFGLRKLRDCTIYEMKTKVLISVTGQLICVFVFAYAKIRSSHDTAHLCYSNSPKIGEWGHLK